MKKSYQSDFNLVIKTRAAIMRRHKGNPSAEDFDDFERVVIMVSAIEGEVSNGGFEQLFFSTYPGDPKYSLALKAFAQIDCQEALEAMREALSLFPGGDPPEDDSIRIQIYENNPEARRDSINSKFWRAHEEIYRKLANYIRLKQSH
jgi:hypothetical protein